MVNSNGILALDVAINLVRNNFIKSSFGLELLFSIGFSLQGLFLILRADRYK